MVPQITTSPPMTPPMMAPTLGEGLPDESPSSEELLVPSVEALFVISVVLDDVSLEMTKDIRDVSDVLDSLDSDVVVMPMVGVM